MSLRAFIKINPNLQQRIPDLWLLHSAFITAENFLCGTSNPIAQLHPGDEEALFSANVHRIYLKLNLNKLPFDVNTTLHYLHVTNVALESKALNKNQSFVCPKLLNLFIQNMSPSRPNLVDMLLVAEKQAKAGEWLKAIDSYKCAFSFVKHSVYGSYESYWSVATNLAKAVLAFANHELQEARRTVAHQEYIRVKIIIQHAREFAAKKFGKDSLPADVKLQLEMAEKGECATSTALISASTAGAVASAAADVSSHAVDAAAQTTVRFTR